MRFTGINYKNWPLRKIVTLFLRPLITTIGSQASRYDGLKTQKLKNRRALFDVELYLTVHKSFVSTSLNITHRGCTVYLSYPYWTITSLYENTMSSITVTVHKLT
jgi:hypothetical protein